MLFNHNPEFAARIRGLELCMFASGIDELFEEFSSNPAIKVISPVEDKPWGIREFTIEDVNGYLLRIGSGFEVKSKQE